MLDSSRKDRKVSRQSGQPPSKPSLVIRIAEKRSPRTLLFFFLKQLQSSVNVTIYKGVPYVQLAYFCSIYIDEQGVREEAEIILKLPSVRATGINQNQ